MSSKQGMIEANKLGSHQTVVIDGTARYSTQLKPGLYELIAKDEACYLKGHTAGTGASDPDATNYWLDAGAGTHWTVEPEVVGAGTAKDFLVVKRAGSGTGTLHINRRDVDA